MALLASAARGRTDGNAGDRQAKSIEARLGGNVEGLPVLVAPGQVSGYLRGYDAPQESAVRIEDPDTGRSGAIDVAQLVDFHPVRHSLCVGTCLELRPNPAARQAAVGRHVERADVKTCRVVDVESLLVGREGDPVGSLEVIGQQMKLARDVDPIDAVEGKLLALGQAWKSVGRIGEEDRS